MGGEGWLEVQRWFAWGSESKLPSVGCAITSNDLTGGCKREKGVERSAWKRRASPAMEAWKDEIAFNSE